MKAFTEKVMVCAEELRLDPVISEEEPYADGMLVCHHNQLENESCRRYEVIRRQCTLG